MYKITLSDGTILNNIGVNGTTLISNSLLDESIFEYNLSPVEIEWIGEGYPMFDISGYHEAMKYISIISPIEGEYWFTLNDIPEDELRYKQLKADIQYVAMMSDVDI